MIRSGSGRPRPAEMPECPLSAPAHFLGRTHRRPPAGPVCPPRAGAEGSRQGAASGAAGGPRRTQCLPSPARGSCWCSGLRAAREPRSLWCRVVCRRPGQQRCSAGRAVRAVRLRVSLPGAVPPLPPHLWEPAAPGPRCRPRVPAGNCPACHGRSAVLFNLSNGAEFSLCHLVTVLFFFFSCSGPQFEEETSEAFGSFAAGSFRL